MEIISKIKKHQNREWLYLQPKGELDMACADEFKEAIIEGLHKSGSRMLWLDFSHILSLIHIYSQKTQHSDADSRGNNIKKESINKAAGQQGPAQSRGQ